MKRISNWWYCKYRNPINKTIEHGYVSRCKVYIEILHLYHDQILLITNNVILQFYPEFAKATITLKSQVTTSLSKNLDNTIKQHNHIIKMEKIMKRISNWWTCIWLSQHFFVSRWKGENELILIVSSNNVPRACDIPTARQLFYILKKIDNTEHETHLDKIINKSLHKNRIIKIQSLPHI